MTPRGDDVPDDADAPEPDDAELGPDGAPAPDQVEGEALDAEVLDEESVEAAEAVVEADLAELARERDDFRELAQRVQADFENYRKRVLREQTAVVERATEGLVTELLSVLDSFELALGTLEAADEQVRKGVELVYSGLVGALERVGLERIPTEGAPFDPTVHEAVLQEDGDGEPVVVETMRPGFRLKGKVLRPAMVKVGH